MKEEHRIDWTAARLRLEQSREALARAFEPDASKVAAVLRDRAARLARQPATISAAEQGAVLVFLAGGERYGIELSRVAGVLEDVDCAPLPDAPRQLAGVAQVRGEIRPVWDAARLLGRPGSQDGDPAPVILLGRGVHQCGLRVERLEGIRGIRPDDRLPAASGAPPHIQFLTADLIAIIDPDKLLQVERT